MSHNYIGKSNGVFKVNALTQDYLGAFHRKTAIKEKDFKKWCFAILRIKTIYLQLREAQGIVDQRQLTSQERADKELAKLQDLSKIQRESYFSQNYLELLCEEPPTNLLLKTQA